MAGGQGQTAGLQGAGKELGQGRDHGAGRSGVVREGAATK
jgi:hypothetical protein